MNFAELRAELLARGTNYLEESGASLARADRWLNEAYREILNAQPWTFRRSTTSGPPPVSIPDLQRVRHVLITASFSPLQRITEDELVEFGVDPATTGTPIYYYVLDGTSVKTYPMTTDSVTVRYLRRIAPMSGTDEPIFDEEYHGLIVDGAMLKAYADTDNFEAAAALTQMYDRRLSSMAEDYFPESREVTYLEPTGLDL